MLCSLPDALWTVAPSLRFSARLTCSQVVLEGGYGGDGVATKTTIEGTACFFHCSRFSVGGACVFGVQPLSSRVGMGWFAQSVRAVCTNVGSIWLKESSAGMATGA